jgi:hypothetical protein
MTLIQRIQIVGVVALVAGATLGATAPQQRSATQTPPVYNVATEVTLSGTIGEVKVIPGAGAQGGVHAILKTSAETVEIDLGPEWFLTQQKYSLASGDAVSVIGSRVKVGAADHIVAREVKKGAETMTFRDAKGFPKWSGRGRL